MRMRFKPYARPELLACDFHVHEPLTHGGHWHELYARPDQPWHLELGCGKGGFLAQIAPAHPDINYLGIDITDKVLILAKRKVEAAYAERGIPADNVKIASLDIERLGNAFTPDDRVSRIYINFCNPWSKNVGSNKHRLTHPRQLLQYRSLMDEGAEIWFKTDRRRHRCRGSSAARRHSGGRECPCRFGARTFPAPQVSLRRALRLRKHRPPPVRRTRASDAAVAPVHKGKHAFPANIFSKPACPCQPMKVPLQ